MAATVPAAPPRGFMVPQRMSFTPPPAPQQVIVRKSNNSALKGRLEDAQELLKKTRERARAKVDAVEGALLTGVGIGAIAHGYARGSGYTEFGGFDVGIVFGGAALVGAQMLPQGSYQRALALGVGAGMMAAVASEYAEGYAIDNGSKS